MGIRASYLIFLKPARGAPSNLMAMAISSSAIDLLWKDNSDNEVGFRVERSDRQIFNLPANQTTFSDTGLAKNRTYSYRVCAFNEAGSSCSNTASAKTPRR